MPIPVSFIKIRIKLFLGHLNVNKDFVTLSGFSSGGTFAQQLYVSYASLFSGIAVFSHSKYITVVICRGVSRAHAVFSETFLYYCTLHFHLIMVSLPMQHITDVARVMGSYGIMTPCVHLQGMPVQINCMIPTMHLMTFTTTSFPV